ncbi:MAG: hypothetical protein NZ772_19245 [Cyanobacteria bacterium]|nr:hypothetical protein [Cyanobacteriota bacterium]
MASWAGRSLAGIALTTAVVWGGVLGRASHAAEDKQTEVKTGQLGPVQAQVTATRDPDAGICATAAQLRILRSGQVVHEQSLSQLDGFCNIIEVMVKNLDLDGEPEIIVDNFSGGAHCCVSSWIYHYNATAKRYAFTRHDWGNAGYRLEDLETSLYRPSDLGRGQVNGLEFRTRDDRFAYAFASYAGSLYPIQIWRFRQGRMLNVTRQYPQLVRASAYQNWLLYEQTKDSIDGGRAALAAYLADKYMLGEATDGWQRVQSAYRASDRTKFFADLRAFLRTTGYTAIPQR